MVRPRALTVFMLITISNFVGCSTGRSAGLAPLRILSTYRSALGDLRQARCVGQHSTCHSAFSRLR